MDRDQARSWLSLLPIGKSPAADTGAPLVERECECESVRRSLPDGGAEQLQNYSGKS